MKTESKSAPDVPAFRRSISRTPSNFVLLVRLSLPSVVLLTKEGPTQSNLVQPNPTIPPPPRATKSEYIRANPTNSLPAGKYSAHPIWLSKGTLRFLKLSKGFFQ